MSGRHRRANVRGHGGGHRWRRIAPVTVAAVAASAGIAFLLYAAGVHAAAAISDGASVALEGQAIGNGHVLLHGWALSYDSFWTLDALFYALASVFVGIRPSLLFAVPAIIATAAIVIGVFMAREGRRGSAAVAAGATVVVLLALPTHSFASFLVRGPFHVVTAMYALLAFAGLRRPRLGWGWVISVVFLTLGMLGDLQTLFYGVVPIFLAGTVAMLRERTWRGGLVTSSAAVACLPLTVVLRKIAKLFGAFTIGPANPLASVHQMLTNTTHVVSYGLELIGASSTHLGTGGVPGPLQAVHVVPAVLMTVSIVWALILLVRGAIVGLPLPPTSIAPVPTDGALGVRSEYWHLDDMLLIATFGSAASFVFLSLNDDFEYSRYLITGMIFAAILAGRMVGRYWSELAVPKLSRLVTVLGILTALSLVSCVGFTLVQAVPTQPALELGTWLEANHLTAGVGDYWSASITTVETSDHVKIRPVVLGAQGLLVRFLRESAANWYAGKRFQFFVYNLAMPWGSDNSTTATKTWGAPAHTYAVGTYSVLVWKSPFVVQEP
jgi:hypothetical protein